MYKYEELPLNVFAFWRGFRVLCRGSRVTSPGFKKLEKNISEQIILSHSRIQMQMKGFVLLSSCTSNRFYDLMKHNASCTVCKFFLVISVRI